MHIVSDLTSYKLRLASANLSSLANAADNAVLSAAGWTANVARHYIDGEANSALLYKADQSDLTGKIAALFSGEIVNPSENRPALHWALRAPDQLTGEADTVRQTLADADTYADAVRSGDITTASGERFRNIVHIGIGGSDFGPRVLADAFRMERDRRFELRFCANLDPLDLDLALDGLNPAETLVIGCLLYTSPSPRDRG